MNAISSFYNKSFVELSRDTLFDCGLLFGTFELIRPNFDQEELPELRHQAVWFMFANLMLRATGKLLEADLVSNSVAIFHLTLYSPHLFGLVHEYGHKFMADHLCESKGQLEFHLHGATHSYDNTGCEEYPHLISAAGPVAEVAAVAAAVLLGHSLRKSYPYAAWTLRTSAIYKIGSLAEYVLSGYRNDAKPSNDFYYLWH